jgi:lipopolysaccharide transport system ATP-binding protein
MPATNHSNEVMIEAKNLDVSFIIQHQGIRNMKDFIFSLGLKKPFEKKEVLKNINLTIYKGECFGLMGKNGSGKSTLLRTIAGIIPSDKGKISLHGTIAPLLALGVGLEPELTGFENIRLCSMLMGRSKKSIQASMDSIISFSELSRDDMEMQVKRYSSGMLARLAFSIAVGENPEILIIDEALSVGDIGFQAKCAARIDEIRNSGSTIVYVSHNFNEIKRICTRAACLSNGTIALTGDVEEVGKYYQSLF